MSKPFHSCQCEKTFTRAAWLALPLVGIEQHEYEDGESESDVQEIRQCDACASTMYHELGTETQMLKAMRTVLVEHAVMRVALGEVQQRCTELKEQVRMFQKIETNADYGKEGVKSIDRVSAYPDDFRSWRSSDAVVEALKKALAPLVDIAEAYDSNNLDDEARKRWGKDLEHENTTPPEQIEIYSGRGGQELLTLAHCLAARAVVREAKR